MPEIRMIAGAVEKIIRKEIKPRLAQAAQETADHVKGLLSGGRRGSIGSGAAGAGLPPHVDTGALRQSIFWDWVDDFAVIVGTTKVYGLYLELGAFVRPKKSKMLAIPWSPEARRHSQGGGTARQFIDARRANLKFIQTPRGAILVVEDKMKGRGKNRTMDHGLIHYILTTHARIPPHPFLRPGLNQMQPRIQEIFRS